MRFEDKESHDITEKTLISVSAAWKKCEDWGDLGMKSGAIFDMDGLLLDTERVYQENWLKTADADGGVCRRRHRHQRRGAAEDYPPVLSGGGRQRQQEAHPVESSPVGTGPACGLPQPEGGENDGGARSLVKRAVLPAARPSQNAGRGKKTNGSSETTRLLTIGRRKTTGR